jgi:hypothetical protein
LKTKPILFPEKGLNEFTESSFLGSPKNPGLLLLKPRARDVLQGYVSQLLSFSTEIFQ